MKTVNISSFNLCDGFDPLDSKDKMNGRPAVSSDSPMISDQINNLELVWISPEDPIPDVCHVCGMFTDRRVAVRHVDFVQQPGSSEEGFGPVLLALFLHFALGPIGWLISIMMHGSENEEGMKTVKAKSKVKISQCPLCQGAVTPEVLDSSVAPTRLLFLVHPRFKSRLAEEKQKLLDSKEREQSWTLPSQR